MARDKLKFEVALKRLELIVESIEQGKVGLEESIASYEEGMSLIRSCRAVLVEAEQKIQFLQAAGTDDVVVSEPPVESS